MEKNNTNNKSKNLSFYESKKNDYLLLLIIGLSEIWLKKFQKLKFIKFLAEF